MRPRRGGHRSARSRRLRGAHADRRRGLQRRVPGHEGAGDQSDGHRRRQVRLHRQQAAVRAARGLRACAGRRHAHHLSEWRQRRRGRDQGGGRRRHDARPLPRAGLRRVHRAPSRHAVRAAHDAASDRSAIARMPQPHLPRGQDLRQRRLQGRERPPRRRRHARRRRDAGGRHLARRRRRRRRASTRASAARASARTARATSTAGRSIAAPETSARRRFLAPSRARRRASCNDVTCTTAAKCTVQCGNERTSCGQVSVQRAGVRRALRRQRHVQRRRGHPARRRDHGQARVQGQQGVPIRVVQRGGVSALVRPRRGTQLRVPRPRRSAVHCPRATAPRGTRPSKGRPFRAPRRSPG